MTFLRRFHALATWFWILAVFPTLIFWRDSVLWVALMSCWANIASHWAAWQASRVEENQASDSNSATLVAKTPEGPKRVKVSSASSS